MSAIKERATKLKEISKKYGYALKHTHALEIISQLDQNVNRHVALNKKGQEVSNYGLNFDKAPYGIDNPFFQGYVIEIKDASSEWINYYVTNESSLNLEVLLEFSEQISSFRFMAENEVADCLNFSFRYEEDEKPVPFSSLLEWINKRARETKESTFLVVSPSDNEESRKKPEWNDFSLNKKSVELYPPSKSDK